MRRLLKLRLEQTLEASRNATLHRLAVERGAPEQDV